MTDEAAIRGTRRDAAKVKQLAIQAQSNTHAALQDTAELFEESGRPEEAARARKYAERARKRQAHAEQMLDEEPDPDDPVD